MEFGGFILDLIYKMGGRWLLRGMQARDNLNRLKIELECSISIIEKQKQKVNVMLEAIEAEKFPTFHEIKQNLDLFSAHSVAVIKLDEIGFLHDYLSGEDIRKLRNLFKKRYCTEGDEKENKRLVITFGAPGTPEAIKKGVLILLAEFEKTFTEDIEFLKSVLEKLN